MSTVQQIFLFFYAIIYGALFTLSDRWKPFTFERGREGRARFLLSLMFFGVLPVLYFSYVFLLLGSERQPLSVDLPSILRVASAFALVVPIYGFYSLWAGIVMLDRRRFYSDATWKLLREEAPAPFLDKEQAVWWLIAGTSCILGAVVILYAIFSIGDSGDTVTDAIRAKRTPIFETPPTIATWERPP